MAESPSIALTLIVKDEEEHLADCLASVVGVCSEIVVYDTGSTDRTIEIAEAHGATVIEGPLIDLSHARNQTLPHVTCDWILWLDADERLPARDGAALRALLQETPADVYGYYLLRYNLFPAGAWYSNWILRVFRNLPGIEYRRALPENVTESIEDLGGSTAAAPVLFNHYGYWLPPDRRRRKLERYLEYLEAEMHAGRRDQVARSLTGLILRILGRTDEALEHALASVRAAPDSPVAQASLGHVLRSAGRNEESRDAFLRAARAVRADAALWNMVAVMEMTMGRLDAAERILRHAWRIDPTVIHVTINQGLVAELGGRYDEAARFYAVAAERNPGFLADKPGGRAEWDATEPWYYETLPRFAGLKYHLAYCTQRAG